jgi:Ca2+-binding RTX toxin-like protein
LGWNTCSRRAVGDPHMIGPAVAIIRIVLIALTAALLTAPAAFAAIRTGDILVANPNVTDAPVIKIDGATGAVSALTGDGIASPNHLSDAYDLVLLPNGQLFVASYEGLPGAFGGVVAVDPNTGGQRVVASGGNIGEPLGIAREPSGTVVIPDDDPQGLGSLSGAVHRIDPATGAQSLVSTNDISGPDHFDVPYAINVERNGRILVGDLTSNGGAVIGVNPATGEQSIVSNNEVSGPDLFGGPSGVLPTPTGLVVTDYSAGEGGVGALLRVDSSGQQSLLSDNSSPGGPDFRSAHRSAFDLGGDFVVADYDFGVDGEGAVFRVDSATGARSLIAGDTSAGDDAFYDPTGLLVVPPKCGGLYPTIVGTPAKEAIKGTRFTDVIAGLGGNDTIKGLAGKDVLCGGPGRDKLFGQAGKDRLFGEAGRDTLRGGKGKDKLRGGKGKDSQRQ